jgi:hypothetical protein
LPSGLSDRPPGENRAPGLKNCTGN